jgi:hypothetical protein
MSAAHDQPPADLKNGLHEMTEDPESAKAVSTPLGELDLALQNYVPGSEEEKKLKRKLDRWMIPMLWWMCVLCYVDRNNIVSLITIQLANLLFRIILTKISRAMPTPPA